MTFTEWYESAHDDKWNEDYALLYSFADKMTNEYESFCNEKSIVPIWNG